MSVTASPEILEKKICICYPVQFQLQLIKAIIDPASKFNVINSSFANKLDVISPSTNIGVQKIDSIYLQTYDMVSAGFSLRNS